MEVCQDLKTKWRGRLEEGTASHNFGPDELAPGKFCVLYSDVGGSGPCCSAAELIGCFDDARDLLGFIQHAELPRILDCATGTYRDVPLIADAYLIDLEDDLRTKVDWLLGLIDRSLRGDTISATELCRIFEKFNEAFSLTNPVVQVLAWGRLADVLASSALEEALEEAVEEEVDEAEQPCTQLKALLASGEFDEHNRQHLDLAKSFLEQMVTF